MVQGLGFRVWGSGFGVQGLGFRVYQPPPRPHPPPATSPRTPPRPTPRCGRGKRSNRCVQYPGLALQLAGIRRPVIQIRGHERDDLVLHGHTRLRQPPHEPPLGRRPAADTVRDQIAVFSSLGLHCSSPESSNLWYKSGGSKEAIWSRNLPTNPPSADAPLRTQMEINLIGKEFQSETFWQ